MTAATRGAAVRALEVSAALAFAWGFGAWAQFSPFGAGWLRATLVLATIVCGSARLRASGAVVIVAIGVVLPLALALLTLLDALRLDVAAPTTVGPPAVVVGAAWAGWTAANRAAAPENLAASYSEITGRAFHARWDDCID